MTKNGQLVDQEGIFNQFDKNVIWIMYCTFKQKTKNVSNIIEIALWPLSKSQEHSNIANQMKHFSATEMYGTMLVSCRLLQMVIFIFDLAEK